MTEAVGAPVKPIQGQARSAGRRRFSKAAQQRIKVGLVALSVAAFGGALGSIVALNPGVKGQSLMAGPTAVNVALPPEPVAPQISSAPLTLPSAAQSLSIRPRTRTRGS